MLLVDTKDKLFIDDEVLKAHIAGLRPVGKWLKEVKYLYIIIMHG